MTLFRPCLMFAALMITGCSTTMHEPNAGDSTLVVGTLVLNAANFERYHNAAVNGRTGNNLEISVVNMDTREEQTISTSGHSGLFHFVAEANAYYRIKKVYYKTEGTRGSWASLWTHPSTIRLVTEADAVHNLGHLAWQADQREEYYQVEPHGNHGAVRERFESRYSKSEWLGKNWVEHTF